MLINSKVFHRSFDLKKAIFIFGIIIGFIIAAHWDAPVYFIQDNSPFYDKDVKSGFKEVKRGLEKTSNSIKNKLTE